MLRFGIMVLKKVFRKAWHVYASKQIILDTCFHFLKFSLLC